MNEKVFRDPVHNYIHVNNQIIYDLINTKNSTFAPYQATGNSSYTFHGGEHSRFSHCLGVYEIAQRITEFLKKNIVKNGILLSLSWPWPLHSFMTSDMVPTPILLNISLIQTTKLLLRRLSKVLKRRFTQVLLQVAPDFPEKVASVIDHTYPNKQVVQLISSQIDADRMDYLFARSYFTGASYGEFDLTRILRVIRPVENGIAFQRNGMHAIETTSSVATRCICRFISTQQHAPWKFSYRISSNALRNSILKTRTSLHELLHISFLLWKKCDLVWLSSSGWWRDEYLLPTLDD